MSPVTSRSTVVSPSRSQSMHNSRSMLPMTPVVTRKMLSSQSFIQSMNGSQSRLTMTPVARRASVSSQSLSQSTHRSPYLTSKSTVAQPARRASVSDQSFASQYLLQAKGPISDVTHRLTLSVQSSRTRTFQLVRGCPSYECTSQRHSQRQGMASRHIENAHRFLRMWHNVPPGSTRRHREFGY
jgi:hypothetical protein